MKFNVFESVKGLEARVNSTSLGFLMFTLIVFLLDVTLINQIDDMKDKQVNKVETLTNDRHIGVVRKFM